MISNGKTKKSTKTAKADQSAPDAKKQELLDLMKGQYLLTDNDKGDNPDRPDLTGQVLLPNGIQANISAWKRWTATNEMKLQGSIQLMDTSDFQTIGRFNLYTTGTKDKSKAIMYGTAEFEHDPAMAVTLKRKISKDGNPYYTGFFNEICKERIDVLADPVVDQNTPDEVAL